MRRRVRANRPNSPLGWIPAFGRGLMGMMSRRFAAVVFGCGLCFGVVAAVSCSDDDEPNGVCRYEPGRCPNGYAGAFCEDDRDCQGVCCTDDKNCDGGMCTFECDDDRDCPSDMACEHDVCFYRCDEDADCAEGQSCEHGNTVCEWP